MDPLSPYAPARATDPPPPARPPARLLPFVWAIVATGLGGTALWQPFVNDLIRDGGYAAKGMAYAIMAAPSTLGFLWAMLSDRLPVLGTRREGYLVVGAVVSVAGWAAAWLGPRSYAAWIAVGAMLTLGTALVATAREGALVELGRVRAATGRLAAVIVGLPFVAGYVSGPLEDVLFDHPLSWTAGFGAALAASLVVASIVSVGDSEPAPASASLAPVRLRRYLLSRAFWAAMGVGFLGRFGQIDTRVLRSFLAGRDGFGVAVLARLMPWGGVGALAAAVGYFAVSKRISLRRLLPGCLLAQALGVAALTAVEPAARLDVLCAVSAGLQGLATVALVHLVLRAAPAGHEALGYWLLTTVPLFVASPLRSLLFLLPPLTGKVTVCAAASLLALLAVPLLPRELLGGPDGAPRGPAA